MTQQGFAESDTAGVLSTRVTESPPQAQQGFAEPTLDTYVQHAVSVHNDKV